MKLTRRKFLKWLATLLAAWGIAPAALAKSADNGPGLAQLPSFDGWHEETFDAVNQKGVTVCSKIITGGRPVVFNSKDYGVVVINSNPNIRWASIINEARKPKP